MTARGAAWERELAAQHDAYRRDRRAALWQTAPRRDRHGTYTARGPVDFLGVLADGRCAAIDAKEHAGKRWPLSALPDHQAADLEAVHLAGGVAGVVLRLDGVAWWVPWVTLRLPWRAWRVGEVARGGGSVDVAWLTECGARVSGSDWLAVAVVECRSWLEAP